MKTTLATDEPDRPKRPVTRTHASVGGVVATDLPAGVTSVANTTSQTEVVLTVDQVDALRGER